MGSTGVQRYRKIYCGNHPTTKLPLPNTCYSIQPPPSTRSSVKTDHGLTGSDGELRLVRT